MKLIIKQINKLLQKDVVITNMGNIGSQEKKSLKV